jgi:heat shock protein HtpX
MTPFLLDPDHLARHRRRNLLQSLLLVAGMSAIVMVSAALIWSWSGAIAAGVLVATIALLGPRVPPETVMRLYGAAPIDPRSGDPLLRMVRVLAERAQLARSPRLYVIPSATLNAFATGSPSNAAIGLTDGLLRQLDLRQIAGVVAHEMSHIRNNDLRVMAMADTLTRFTQMLAYLGLMLGLLNLPMALMGLETISWSAVLLLYLAPLLASLLQMGLSRTREYDADLEAAGLTGDPAGLASALAALERYQGRFWEDLMLPVPSRRIPHPSLLRSHPETADRIARLRELEDRSPQRHPMLVDGRPLAPPARPGLVIAAPRYRLPGVWY